MLRSLCVVLGLIVLAQPVAAAAAAPVEKKVLRKQTKAARTSVPPKKLQLQNDGALGYDWAEWKNVAASRDVRLRWRLGVTAASAAPTGPAAPSGDASLARLFEEERSHSQVMITDTPLHRDGALTLGVRLEF